MREEGVGWFHDHKERRQGREMWRDGNLHVAEQSHELRDHAQASKDLNSKQRHLGNNYWVAVIKYDVYLNEGQKSCFAKLGFGDRLLTDAHQTVLHGFEIW